MDDNFGEWVESMRVASRRGYQEVGVSSEWNLCLCLQCIGVVSGCCCNNVYRYPHNNYSFHLFRLYYLFFGSSIPTSLFIFIMFFPSC